MTIGLGTAIGSEWEFNRRAAKALKAFEPQGPFDKQFCERIPKLIEAGAQLTEKQQITLYQVVNRYAGRIWDKQITDFAAVRIKEHG